ncbi:hypothetical protein BDW74DRAFT_178223 [Aspergillus multicolor]|uniref:uncharacterized protein n=1 Tax=Aspergillus multicolor TaxID=41759 RepID=UPI003CCDF4E8
MPTAAERMKALAKPRATQPELKQLRPGFYYAPNGERYYGEGEVVENGTTHDGGVYIRVEPPYRYYDPDGKDAFFDPYTGENMAEQLLPEWFFGDKGGSMGTASQPPPPRPVPNRDVKTGDEAPGWYWTATKVKHYGNGRVVKMHREFDESGAVKKQSCYVEPIPGQRFLDVPGRKDLPEQDRPRVPYTPPRSSANTDLDVDADVDKRQKGTGLWFGGLQAPTHRGTPRLGGEEPGAYLAPDGQWYVGVGKVIAVGLNGNRHRTIGGHRFVYVEPIPGKSGGDYDFFHPITLEWMASFAHLPRPGEGADPDPNATHDAGAPDHRHQL